MTNSRSKASRSSLRRALIVLCAIAGLFGATGVAEAGRRRVVVLDLDGAKHQQVHDGLVKLLKKAHTVISTDKWDGTVESLGADMATDKGIKRVARKLMIDAVVAGKVEKRRDAYVVKLELRLGKSGALLGAPIEVTSSTSALDGKAQRALRKELVAAIGEVETNHGGDVEEADEPATTATLAAKADELREPSDAPAGKTAKSGKPDERTGKAGKADERTSKTDERTSKSGKTDERTSKSDKTDEAAGKPEEVASRSGKRGKSGKGRKTGKLAAKFDEEPAKSDEPAKTDEPAKPDDDPEANAEPAKRVASRDPDDSAVSEGAARSSPAETSPGERALDLVVGMSITARSLSFQFRPGFAQTTPGYSGAPVGGVMLDTTIYPFALGHAHRGFVENLGLSLMYDRVVQIKSRDAMNNLLDTTQSRFGIGGVARYPIGDSDNAPVIGATFSYANQVFEIAPGVDVPNVSYAIFEPGVLFRLPLFSRAVVGLDGKLMLFSSTGQLEDAMHYGTTTPVGFEGALTLDVMFSRNVFARAAFRYETIGLTFQGNGALTAGRDNDLTTADVKSGQDTYVGGFITLGVAL